MPDTICHYCLELKDDISINGQYRAKGGKFISYRLCTGCSKKLIGINAYSDKQARQTFLATVRKNAKKDPTYK